MKGSEVVTLFLWSLPVVFAGLLVWLQARLARQKQGVRFVAYGLAGYLLLGVYQLLSDRRATIQQATRIDERTVTVLSEPTVLKQGKTIFDTRCISCHGANGEGVIGPNLTDDYWLYGGSIRDIFRTIRHGIPQTPMVAWKHALTDQEQQAVANYIYRLRGSNPPNSKPPQGFVYIRPTETR